MAPCPPSRGPHVRECTCGRGLAGFFWLADSLLPHLALLPLASQEPGPGAWWAWVCGISAQPHPCSLCPPYSNSPDDVAMRLAFIGDEMEVRWMMPRVGELPGMAMYSLAFTYNQTGLRGVLRSLVDGLANLRENIRIWGFLTLRNRVSPNSGRGLALSLLLLVLLLGWGLHLLQ
ncbi:bcl-2-interacting killer isoform X2 [Panthera leo]|uniref:bcl-2-interacting killer isoform X2 n=1 Tax=Panthera leo TaxID=9689 RepID=UPI001C69B872|nr:bcl-2-interacting killer isoform X2 [Panthera leo]